MEWCILSDFCCFYIMRRTSRRPQPTANPLHPIFHGMVHSVGLLLFLYYAANFTPTTAHCEPTASHISWNGAFCRTFVVFILCGELHADHSPLRTHCIPYFMEWCILSDFCCFYIMRRTSRRPQPTANPL